MKGYRLSKSRRAKLAMTLRHFGLAVLTLMPPTKRLELRDLLAGARTRIADYDQWSGSALAERPDGLAVPVQHKDACRWCAIGAVLLVAGAASSRGFGRYMYAVDPIVRLNDGVPFQSTGRRVGGRCPPRARHAQVLEVYDDALAWLDARDNRKED